MDYRELLRKYIAHVVKLEGSDFLITPNRETTAFSEIEWAELQRLATWSSEVVEALRKGGRLSTLFDAALPPPTSLEWQMLLKSVPDTEFMKFFDDNRNMLYVARDFIGGP